MNKKRKLIRKQNESNKKMKQNERRQKGEKIIEDIDLDRFSELATTNKSYVNGLKLHENKNDILEDDRGGFELIGSMLIGELEQKTNIRFKKTDDFETFVNAIDNGGDNSEDVTFTKWLYNINIHDFKKVNRSP